MPKIIENLRETLLIEAERQISKRGYKNTTIRSVAKECGVAVGTVYNYFKSKDILIASFILQNWIECVNSIGAYPKENRKDYIEYIHISLNKFAGKYNKLFSDGEAKATFAGSFAERHGQLRSQLAALILPICPNNDLFLSEFVAEALLTWTMAGRSFESIYDLLPEQIK